MDTKQLCKQVDSICNVKTKPYPINKIKLQIKHLYLHNKNMLNENTLLERLLYIDTRINYYPNAIMAVVWGLISGFILLLFFNEESGFTPIIIDFYDSISKLIKNPNYDYKILHIVLTTAVYLSVLAAIIILAYFLLKIGVTKTKKIWRNEYSLFIASYERMILLRLLNEMMIDVDTELSEVNSYTAKTVKPRKLHFIMYNNKKIKVTKL